MSAKFNNNRDIFESSKDISAAGNDYQVIEFNDYFSLDGTNKLRSKNLGEKFTSISSFFFEYLKQYHIPTAYLKSNNRNSLRFTKYNRYPFYVKILNTVNKRTSEIFDKPERSILSQPIFEYHFGNSYNSLITESHLVTFEICSFEDLRIINRICSKINAVLRSFFERRGLLLAEINCYFGKNEEKIFVVDDFTPKSIRIISHQNDIKWPDPYSINSGADMKKYTDSLHNLMSI